jgi:hypothetical protein
MQDAGSAVGMPVSLVMNITVQLWQIEYLQAVQQVHCPDLVQQQ